jgi:hypothetical protein
MSIRKPVGANLLAMVDNDYARFLVNRGVLGTIASRLAPTVTFTLFADLLSEG